jgi:hypothetical protein
MKRLASNTPDTKRTIKARGEAIDPNDLGMTVTDNPFIEEIALSKVKFDMLQNSLKFDVGHVSLINFRLDKNGGLQRTSPTLD